MYRNKVNMEQETSELSTSFLLVREPQRHIRRWNRCLWIMIVTFVWTALMLGFMIPGIVGLAQGDIYDDTLLYVGIVCFIFAGLFFTFWYICQIEVDDVDIFDREITKKSIKRRDEGGRHMRPKSLRSPLTSTSSTNRKDEFVERSSLVGEHVVQYATA